MSFSKFNCSASCGLIKGKTTYFKDLKRRKTLIFLKRTAVYIFLISFATFLSSCQKTEERPLVIIDNILVKKESWQNKSSISNSLAWPLLFDPLLYRTFHNSKVYNVLIEDMNDMEDGSVQIRLKEGIRFHDKKPFTSFDVKAFQERARLEFPGLFDRWLKHLEIEVQDSRTLRIKSTKPGIDMLFALSAIYAVPPEGSEPWTGSGPYRVESWFDGGLHLAANEAYFEGAPKINKIIYLHEEDESKRLYKLLKGEADLMVLLSPPVANFLKEDSRFYVNSIKGRQLHSIKFNYNVPLMGDVNIRKAISMAINREALIEKGLLGAGEKAFTPFPQKASSYRKSQTYRPKEALRLLKEAGWEFDKEGGILKKEGEKFRLTLCYIEGFDAYPRIVDIISQQLYEVGIEVDAWSISLEDTLKRDGKSADAMAYLGPYTASANDIFYWWHSSSAANIGSFKNSKADLLLEKLVKAGDEKEKKDIYAELQQIFDDEVPAAFMYYDLFYTAANKRFKGAEDFVANIYSVYKIKDWSISNAH